ncbi:MAG: hypothetical protein N2376_10900 [Clostridia bacterium]|nr:hypothetical protein [Clostridia bacterium]
MGTPNVVQKDFDTIAQLDEPKWEHNIHYHSFFIKHLPETLGDYLLSSAAVSLNIAMSFAKTGRLKKSKEERSLEQAYR